MIDGWSDSASSARHSGCDFHGSTAKQSGGRCEWKWWKLLDEMEEDGIGWNPRFFGWKRNFGKKDLLDLQDGWKKKMVG